MWEDSACEHRGAPRRAWRPEAGLVVAWGGLGTYWVAWDECTLGYGARSLQIVL